MDNAQDKTRQRLLEAAGEVFAEQGFRQATVRDICARAGANVAAVNYHFGDKEKLYSEVLRFAHGCAIEKYPPSLGLPPDAPAEKRLHAFVLSFLSRLLDDGRPAWHAKIMSREMAEPTGAMDMLVDEQIKPHWNCSALRRGRKRSASVPRASSGNASSITSANRSRGGYSRSASSG